MVRFLRRLGLVALIGLAALGGCVYNRLSHLGYERITDDAFLIRGFGSNGGEEYVSFMMASTSLAAAGGAEASVQWDSNIRSKLGSLQNADGSWAGHHCITGRVFCTASAILTLTADRAAATPSVAAAGNGK